MARVEFRVDGVLVGTDLTAPYTATWNSASASVGFHTIQARAIDAAGNAADSSVVVTVPALAETLTPVYRFHNKKNGSHFYTASEAEKNAALTSATYSLDGVAYHVSSAFDVPLYRFYNKMNGSHFYTASEAEKNAVLGTWRRLIPTMAWRSTCLPSRWLD